MVLFIKRYFINLVFNRTKSSYFSRRQVDILQKIVKGKSTMEITQELNISPESLGSNIKSIYKTLHANNKTGTIANYLQQDLL